MEDVINRVRELLAKRDAIDTELKALFAGAEVKEKRTVHCSRCNEPGHTARTCSKPE